MLVLSRDEKESILIGHDITVRVLQIIGSMVRLGIDAPRDVPVHREEVYRRIHERTCRQAIAHSEPSRLETHRAVDLSALPGFR
ncbi:carbon storage regulator CsrA [Tahibacter aquaticus]|uniref:Translational regulator CsrA n=1 Tax=Tahibacter aquaticus TaxID=520092 RepID=A0A4R6YPN7_9GAMM|nr:carbon storage regulator CsrA [Tahibacter aquaticus]TDR39663.1 carbon storage regulator CsrA [Tahibacter aquaticus]